VSGSITVAVVGICGASHALRCLEALGRQVDAPDFDVVLVHDPNLRDMERIAEQHPDVTIVNNENQRSPLELAARAMHEATGEIVLLTEDHCIPQPDWVATLVGSLQPGRAAVGGVVQADDTIRSVDWAFYLVDFFRYMPPVEAGPSPSLTVCNVAYRKADVDQISSLWQTIFHETAINDALKNRFGVLWLDPKAVVRMRRTVRLWDAVYERYAFGRLFGCTRLEFCGPWRRAYYALFAPALPLLLMARMAAKVMRRRSSAAAFARGLPVLLLMVLAWSWGEWLGYLTRRRPKSLVVAPEIRAAQRGAPA